MIRPINIADAKSIAKIYNHFISNTIVTFEENLISDSDMSKRIEESSSNLPWLVAEENGIVIGYAFASKWKGRCAYRHSVETTVYLSPAVTSKGWGTKLYNSLFDALKTSGFHTAISGIALPNPASVALHEKFNMNKVAHFSEVGRKFDQWVDVGYWQRKIDL